MQQLQSPSKTLQGVGDALTWSLLGLRTSNDAVVEKDVREKGTVSCTCMNEYILLVTNLEAHCKILNRCSRNHAQLRQTTRDKPKLLCKGRDTIDSVVPCRLSCAVEVLKAAAGAPCSPQSKWIPQSSG